MDNPHHGNDNIFSGLSDHQSLRFYSPSKTRQSGSTATHEIQTFDDPSVFQEGEILAPYLWSMIGGSNLGSHEPQASGFVQNFAANVGNDQSAGLQNNTYNQTFGPQHVGSSSYPTLSNPAPSGEGPFGISHQTFPNVSYPREQVYGFFFDRSHSLPKAYFGIGLVPAFKRYKANGYLYADGLGILPYYVRSEKDLQKNHVIVGYLQKAGALLDKNNKVYFHFENAQELQVLHPQTANLIAMLRRQTAPRDIEITVIMEQQMGSEVYSPTFVIMYRDGAPFVLEHGRTMLFEHFRGKILAAPRDPIRDIQNYSTPTVDNEQGGDEDDKEVEDSISSPGTTRIPKYLLQKNTPKFNKLLDDTILFFHVKLLKGEYFYPAVDDQNLSPGRKQLVDRVCCHSAWAEALAYSESGEYEESYRDQDSSMPLVRIIVEDHFYYILCNQKKAAAAYFKFILEQVKCLVDEIGDNAFLHLFSYELNEIHFNDHQLRAAATLCNHLDKPFHQPRFIECLKTLFYGPVPPTRTTWPTRAKSVGYAHFRGKLTVDVIGVLAAHWLFAGIRLSKRFVPSGMPTDIRSLVSAMRSRLLLTPPAYIESLQAIIDSPAAPMS